MYFSADFYKKRAEFFKNGSFKLIFSHYCNSTVKIDIYILRRAKALFLLYFLLKLGHAVKMCPQKAVFLYIKIIKNEHSRVALITQIMKTYNIDMSDIISEEEMRELIKNSKSNKTGVRWVSAQIENRMFEFLRENGVGDIRIIEKTEPEKAKEDEFFF